MTTVTDDVRAVQRHADRLDREAARLDKRAAELHARAVVG